MTMYGRIALCVAAVTFRSHEFGRRPRSWSALTSRSSVKNSAGLNYKELEKPLWEEWIPEASNGKVTGDMLPFDQVGLDNATILRLLKQGAMDIGTTDASRLAADDPRFEGADLAGIALTIEDARRAVDAYRSGSQRNHGGELERQGALLGAGASTGVLVPGADHRSSRTSRERRSRVFNKTMIDFLDGVGATRRQHQFPGGGSGAPARRGGLRRGPGP